MTFELIVTVGASPKDEKLFTLAIEVHASDGTLLKEGIASPTEPFRTRLAQQPRVHLLTRLPGGERLQKSVDIEAGSSKVTVDVLSEVGSPHEWLKWASSLRDLAHLMPDSLPRTGSARDNQAIANRSAIGEVWALLWEFRGKEWTPSKLKPLSSKVDRGMRQIEFMLPKRAHLLQIGGESVSWRLVSLPSGGAARVAFTESQPGVDDSVQLTIGRETPGAEIVMSYLTRGALPEAAQLEGLWRPAEKLLQGKHDDAIGAAAGAYVLLRIGRLEERNEWAQRLVEVAPWMADGPIIAAAVALRLDPPDRTLARRRVSQALHRGLPVFGMGLDLLVETMTRLHRGKSEDRAFHHAFLAMQGYLQARASRHSYLSFFGETPTRPSSVQLRGKAGQPTAYGSVAGGAGLRHTTLQVGSTKVTLAVPKSVTVSSSSRLAKTGISAEMENIALKRATDIVTDSAFGPGSGPDLGPRRGRSLLVPSSGRDVSEQSNSSTSDDPIRRATSNTNSLASQARRKRASLALPIFGDTE